jgi:TPR repeat protein
MLLMIERARKGDAESLHQAGLIYLLGTHGVEQDLQNGKLMIESAAAKGSIHAHNQLGNIHQNGIGTPVDEEKAKFHYGTAAMKGDYHERYNLAYLEKDEVKKIRHIVIATSQGSKVAIDDIRQRHKDNPSIVTRKLVESTLCDHLSALKSFDSPSR